MQSLFGYCRLTPITESKLNIFSVTCLKLKKSFNSVEFRLNTENQTTVLHASPMYDILRAEGANFHTFPTKQRAKLASSGSPSLYEVGKSIL